MRLNVRINLTYRRDMQIQQARCCLSYQDNFVF